jgi:serine/threonine protein kinase
VSGQSDNIMLDADGRAVIADFGLVCPTITVHDHTGKQNGPT